MRAILAGVHAPMDGAASNIGCDYALIGIDAAKEQVRRFCELARMIATTISKFKCKDNTPRFECIEFWDTHQIIISRNTAIEVIGEKKINKVTASQKPAKVVLSRKQWEQAISKYEPVLCSMCHADTESVYWSFSPRGRLQLCETSEIPLALFD